MMRLNDSAFSPTQFSRWYIWGMPLSGKTSLGKKLKKILPFPMFDLDKELELRFGKTVSQLFADEGEGPFRIYEADLLREISTSNDAFLIVAGGGTPCFYENDVWMLESGNCLFMHTSIDEILKRSEMQTDNQRPLLQGDSAKRLTELYEHRLPIYQKAHAEFYSEKEALTYLRDWAIF